MKADTMAAIGDSHHGGVMPGQQFHGREAAEPNGIPARGGCQDAQARDPIQVQGAGQVQEREQVARERGRRPGRCQGFATWSCVLGQ